MIAAPTKAWYEPAMESLFGNPAYKRFVLQDAKRLPARFYTRLVGTRLVRVA